MIRARGFSPSSRCPLGRHDDHRRSAVVQRAGVAGGHLAARLEGRLERGELLVGRRAPRAVVQLDAFVRGQLALEEPGVLRRDRALLRALREPVHLLTRDVPVLGHVLGGQAHRDVDVRDRRVVAEQRGVELLVALRIAVDLRDRLDAGGDERVALAGLDRVVRHADRLQARGAEPVDGRPRHARRQAREQRGAAAQVHPLLRLGEAAADDHVDDLLGRQRRARARAPCGSRTRPDRRAAPRSASPCRPARSACARWKR